MFSDEDFIRHLIRGIWTTLVMAICVVIYLIVKTIGNERVKWLVWRVFLILLLFFVGLVSAFIVDVYTGFKIAYFTSTVNITFWGLCLGFVIFVLYRLRSEPKEIHNTAGTVQPNPRYIDTEQVSDLLSELMDALKIQGKKGKAFQTKLENSLPKN